VLLIISTKLSNKLLAQNGFRKTVKKFKERIRIFEKSKKQEGIAEQGLQ